MFARVEGWLVSAGIAQGRGGYPGGRDRPGWLEYVEEQRRNLAVLRALVDAFGAPSSSTTETLRAYEEEFPLPQRRLSDGYEAHVNDVGGRLIYSLPVSWRVSTTSFSFSITIEDLDVLKNDVRRRATLETIAHRLFQGSLLRGHPEVTEVEFGRGA